MSRRLAGVEVVVVRMVLREPWVTPLGTITGRDVVLVRVVADGAEGWGECVAQPEPTYTSEYAQAAHEVLERHLVPRLLAADPTSDGVAGALAAVKGHPMAKGALELAVLDAEGRRDGRSLASLLSARAAGGPTPAARVTAGVAVGVSGDVDRLLDEVGRWVQAGYRRVKLKVHPGWDEEPVAAVRQAWPDLALQVDANGTYAQLGLAEATERLACLDHLDLLLVEQPLGDDDLLGHAALAARLATPVCLDESVTSPDVASTALALGACGVVNVKAGRVGGYLAAVEVHDRCRVAGVPVWCGGMLETGVGRAANLALAALPNFSLPGDLSAADRFWAADIVVDPVRLGADGTIAVPDGPGTGVELIPDLDRQVVSRTWFRP